MLLLSGCGAAARVPSPTTARIDRQSGLEFVRIPSGHYPSTAAGNRVSTDVGPLWIGKTDVTAQAYDSCAAAGSCSNAPLARDESMPRCSYKNNRLTHPMNCVSWTEATEFCLWIHGRLPTSVEWEYAATSGQPGKAYPWGEEPVDRTRANYCDVNCPKALSTDGKNLVKWQELGLIDQTQNDGWAATSPVGSYPAGATAWGLLEMAGNVWQWTSTPDGENKYYVRGGSWDNAPAALKIDKQLAWPDRPDAGMGFRCVMN
jgi:formylglycine-generating enzyme required for sulfatase activity